MAIHSLRHAPWFENAYRIGIAIKGFDGFVELVAGVALLVAPGLVHAALSAIFQATHLHDGHTAQFIASYVARLDAEAARNGITFLIVFLIGHGVVKLVLVYCLLRRIVWAYPYALAVLGFFLLYQLYVLALDPLSPGMWLFTVLDTLIIWLVWGEWQDLRENPHEPVQ